MIISRNVIFNENEFPCKIQSETEPAGSIPVKETILEDPENNPNDQNDFIEVETSQSDTTQDLSEPEFETESNDSSLTDYQLTRDRDRRNRIPSTRYNNDEFVTLFSVLNSLNSEPATFEEVVTCSDFKLWKDAMNEKMDSLIKNKTWILVNKPKNQKVLDCK